MGVPLTNYSVLKYLAEGEENKSNNTEIRVALEALKDYSVFAFILHDPKEHFDFHHYLSKKFEDFHYGSGANLVFFGLVDSPEQLVLEGERPFYQNIREGVRAYEKQGENTLDNTYSAFALSNTLRIPSELLPVIVVTHDPRLKSFRYIKTDSKLVERQFDSLIRISNRMNAIKRKGSISLQDKQNKFFEQLDSLEFSQLSTAVDRKSVV